MKKIALTLFIALLALPVMAEEWEYKVVSIPVEIDPAKAEATYQTNDDGTLFEVRKTEVIAKWVAEGWEPISISGSWASVILFRRAKR